MSLKERFAGDLGRRTLVSELQKQSLLRGDEKLATAFAERGEVQYLTVGETLITQGEWDTDLYFVVVGAFDVLINGQKKATRRAGEHVGELAGLSAARPRTATLEAATESLVLKVKAADIDALVKDNADFWRATADVVAQRLDQRNLEIGAVNEHPRVFVISSSEAIDVARHVRAQLNSATLHIYLWDKGTFGISDYPLSDLEDAIEAADFTISVVRPDDSLITRGNANTVARDNVHLEYGISLGKLGRVRSIVLVDAEPGLRLPSDMAGLTTVRYRARDRAEMERTVATACDDIRKHIERHNVRENRRN